MRRWSIPSDSWPPREKVFWRERVHATCELITGQQGALLSIHTIEILRRAFEQWMSFLIRTNRYRSDLSVFDHFDRTNALEFIEEALKRKKPQSVRADLSRVMACFRIAYGREKLAWARELVLQLRRLERRVPTPPKPLRLSPELFQLGLDLIRNASEASCRHARAAISYRDGLLISMLAARPVRLANIASMRIDKNLVIEGRTYWLHFTERETKTGLPLSLPLPRSLVDPIRIYLLSVRPTLIRRGRIHDFVWPSIRGGPLAYGSVYRAITSRTMVAFRHRVSPHGFRHAAATSVALLDPRYTADVHRLLGHISHTVAEQHYIHASTVEAAKRLQLVIANLRRRQ